MSGWIDPLGVHVLRSFLNHEINRLNDLARIQDDRIQHSRRAARYRGRAGELGRLEALIKALTRPGRELLPYKELVQAGSEQRRAKLKLVTSKEPA